MEENLPLPGAEGLLAFSGMVEYRDMGLPEQAGRIVPIQKVRSRRSRYLRAYLHNSGAIRVSIPWRCSNKETDAFIEKNREWILSQWQQYSQRKSLLDYLREHPTLSWDGASWHLLIEGGLSRSFFLMDTSRRQVLFRIREGVDAGREMFSLCRRVAHEVLPPRIEHLAGQHSFSYSRVSIRDQSSRWGSCSSSGTLSLNWRLILLPPALQDHVLLHELAHTVQMNHSPDFWSLLFRCDPNTRKHNQELQRYSEILFKLCTK